MSEPIEDVLGRLVSEVARAQNVDQAVVKTACAEMFATYKRAAWDGFTVDDGGSPGYIDSGITIERAQGGVTIYLEAIDRDEAIALLENAAAALEARTPR